MTADSTLDLADIKSFCPCRDTEIEELHAVLTNLPRPSSLLVYGQHQTCKTRLLSTYLAQAAKSGLSHLQRVARLDVRQCITQRSFYERTIDEILGTTIMYNRDGRLESDSVAIDNLDAFHRRLVRVLSTDDQQDTIIVFDHFSLTQFDNSEAIMTMIVEVLQSCKGNATAIFVVSRYSDVPRTLSLPTIHFRLYTPADILTILKQDAERAYEQADEVDSALWPSIWQHYCQTIYGTFVELVGHDLQLYRLLAKKLLPAYLEPVRQGRLEATNHVQLARAAQAAMAREAWITEEEQITEDQSGLTVQQRKMAHESELSVSTRYLLVAAFLASYNPVRTDVMFFSKGRGPAKKRRAAVGKHAKAEQLPQKVLGPKGFPIERMIAIYHAISPRTVPDDVTIDQQASHLQCLYQS
ncbi:origin recognition complex subunit 5 C-terminus-domain-containing protein [Protomyces lactucae-debilis]|uniref:Origin recognition complex subunit 5 C-terminus-domain-containing protein n=1 Tax=Protomyces lactucae-debilis TaxID=2754530 RepID=A0A1Y2F5Q3_PROLT|nr:origin recognition complex subunit 5 C-terminus-domain-containing protein [Protomyces lactucae-debilis]ORY78676.1 origin recognition complex subunit 5 C-terminus-domain-containing protein [Protomyces lactucae-debilis]